MATYSSGSTVVWRLVAESTYGTLPATAMNTLRPKASNVDLKKDVYTSDEVRADRGISDVRHGMKKVEGSLVGELIYADWDPLFQGMFLNTWLPGGAVANMITYNGTTLSSFCLEQGFLDIVQYRMFKGVCVSKWKLAVKPNALAEVTFDLIGQDGSISGSAAANATTAATKNSPMSYSNGVITEGGTAIAYVTGVDLDVDNGLMQPGVVGSALSPAVLWGRCTVKGTVTALFKDSTLLSKFLNETTSQLQFSLSDPQGNTITFLLPNIKYTGGTIAPPKDGAVILTLPFQALQQLAATATGVTTYQITAASRTLTRVGGSFITDGFQVGDVVTLTNFTSGGNNGNFVVATCAALTMTFNAIPGNTMVDEAAALGARTCVGPAFTLGVSKF